MHFVFTKRLNKTIKDCVSSHQIKPRVVYVGVIHNICTPKAVYTRMLGHIARRFLRGQFARHYGAGRGVQVCEKVGPKFKRLKELQRQFSCDDGVPVHLKGGSKDKILFQLTAAGIGVGLLMVVNVFYCLIMPGANKPPPIKGVDDE